ncbi:hypothetical protein BMF94_3371 [Rhodotorula taiwanensis]|uniref:Uncharacterized protein n=1 Tax=Rhodotorula taiwanensis TaxID=741276 RepID=A0A2S5BAM5_9BASI|nr:hypothetical protein BMF94_3371 [Rhodotorula taiwanensis]
MPTILNSALSLPPATRTLTIALVSCTLLFTLLRLSVSPKDLKTLLGATGDSSLLFPWLVLVPGNVLYAPWTLLVSSFVEVNLIEFLISILTLPLAARYLERVWGAAELLKFVAAVVVVSNVIAVFVNIIESIALGDRALFLYGMSYHGLSALQVGFLVAFTQLIPEHQVQVFGGLFHMRVKSLPMLYVTFSNIVCVLGYQSPYILVQFGWLVSWFYLRFFKYNDGVDFRGDRSETFAFHNWFPPLIQKYVQRLAGFAFSLAVRFKVLPSWGIDVESGSSVLGNGVTGAGGASYTPVPGGQRAEAERRRQLALEALDRRMAAPPTTPASTVLGGGATSSTSPVLGSGLTMSSSSGAGAGARPTTPGGDAKDAAGVTATGDKAT